MRILTALLAPLICSILTSLSLLAPVHALAAQNPIRVSSTSEAPVLKLPSVGTDIPLGTSVELPIVPAGATDFALEFSNDLQHWQILWNYHVGSTDLVTVPASTPRPDSKAYRFYRLRIPGDLVDDKRAQWESLGITSYRYHYAPLIGFCNCINSADVTVQNGAVVSVTNAVRASGKPEPNPKLADFPTIEVLFQSVLEAEQSSELVWVGVQYDPVLSYPTDLRLWAIPDMGHGFVISDFQVLQ